jgi:hypothetical protein
MSSQKLIKDLIRALAQTSGNKVYLRDVEKILNEKLADITQQEVHTMYFLVRDLGLVSTKLHQANRRKKQPWLP